MISTASLQQFQKAWRFIVMYVEIFFRYFIGSSASTVSYRIREDREILGFEPSTTFNRFCGDDETDCEQPAHWTIVY